MVRHENFDEAMSVQRLERIEVDVLQKLIELRFGELEAGSADDTQELQTRELSVSLCVFDFELLHHERVAIRHPPL